MYCFSFVYFLDGMAGGAVPDVSPWIFSFSTLFIWSFRRSFQDRSKYLAAEISQWPQINPYSNGVGTLRGSDTLDAQAILPAIAAEQIISFAFFALEYLDSHLN